MRWVLAILAAVAAAGVCVLIDYLALVVWPRAQGDADDAPPPPPARLESPPSAVDPVAVDGRRAA